MDEDRIILDWRDVHDESGRWSDRWDYNLAVYAILHPTADEILYLGKADGCHGTLLAWGPDPPLRQRSRQWRPQRISDSEHTDQHRQPIACGASQPSAPARPCRIDSVVCAAGSDPHYIQRLCARMPQARPPAPPQPTSGSRVALFLCLCLGLGLAIANA